MIKKLQKYWCWTVMCLIYSTPVLSFSEQQWALSFQQSHSEFDFRGSVDQAQSSTIKLDWLWNENWSTYIAYGESSDYMLNDVPRVEINSVEIQGVSVASEYEEFQIGFTRRFEFERIELETTLGISTIDFSGTALVPGFGDIPVSDDDTIPFVNLGLNYSLDRNWYITSGIRYNQLFSDSSLLNFGFGIEYRF